MARDAAAHNALREPGVQASRTLGSYSNPVYELCSNLEPTVSHNSGASRISSCRNALYNRSVRPGSASAITPPAATVHDVVAQTGVQLRKIIDTASGDAT